MKCGNTETFSQLFCFHGVGRGVNLRPLMETMPSNEPVDERELELLTQVCDVFMRLGIKAVNMDDVARHLGVSKKTLYKHFKDKRDLVIRSLHQMLNETDRRMRSMLDHPGNAIDAEFAMMRYVRKMLSAQHPSVMFDLQKYYTSAWAEVTEKRERLIYLSAQQNLERGQREGVYRSDFDPPIVARFMVSIAGTTKSAQTQLELGKTMSELYFESFQYHIRGIASPKGLQYLEEKLAAEFPLSE
jgi:AcrR family transcriptional regulator